MCVLTQNPQLIGQRFGGHEVRSADTLAEFIECNKPDVAVLTIPRGDAPRIARGLVERGIRGLWNFTGEDLLAPGCAGRQKLFQQRRLAAVVQAADGQHRRALELDLLGQSLFLFTVQN